MSEVYVLQGTHPYVPGRVLDVYASKPAAEKQAVELINLIRKDMCAGQQIFEATVDNYVTVLESLKEHYATLYETDEDRFDVWIEKMVVLQ